MNIESTYYKEIINRLEFIDRKEYLRLILLGFLKTGLIGISLFTLFSFAELLGNLSSLVRTILFFVFLITVLDLFLFNVIVPLFKYFKIFTERNYLETAGKVGNHFPGIKDDLKNAMQLVAVNEPLSLLIFSY